MPTILTGEPKAPGTDRTLDETMLYGREQWQAVWKAWARQWSQPELIKLAEQTLKCRCIHSSQIHGFATGKLRDPAPKLLVAIGQLNLALQGVREEGGRRIKCPGTLKKLWEHADLLTTSRCYGTSGGVQRCGGAARPGGGYQSGYSGGARAGGGKALDTYGWRLLRVASIGWRLPELRGMCKSMEPLLMGKKVGGAQLLKDLPAIAEAVACEEICG